MPSSYNGTSTPLEWLETNGLGDYAAGTSTACNSRRYHGLLVANVENYGRHVLLSTIEDRLVTDKGTFPLSSRKHPCCLWPEGGKHLEYWKSEPWPSFTYRVGSYRITREILLLQGRHTLLVRYTLKAASKAVDPDRHVVLRVAPLLAYRSFHSLTCANIDLQVKTYPALSGFKIQPYNSLPPLFLQVSGSFSFLPSPEWIKQVEYETEQERGFPYSEDLFCPGIALIDMRPGQSVVLSASTEEMFPMPSPEEKLWKRRHADPEAQLDLAPYYEEEKLFRRREKRSNSVTGVLARKSGAFLIRTPSGSSSVLAGYHWFDSWGRDTLIALPGVSFFAKRRGEGMAVLRRITDGVSDGLIPNTFTSSGVPNGWNSVDASLWYAWTVQQLLESVEKPYGSPHRRYEDKEQVRVLRESTQKAAEREQWKQWKKEWRDIYAPVLRGIIRSYRSNHVPFAEEDEEGLLDVGTPDTQLTWMDAQVNGKPVTPRNGFPVEIEALWYNTLAFSHELSMATGAEDLCPQTRLDGIREAFKRRFLLPDGSLRDVWRPEESGGPDDSVRPNQLLAVSMPFPIFDPAEAGPMLEKVKKELFTPFGLRTLSPKDPAYCPYYGGGPEQRDGAYHQGTVWPWLLGPYTDALFAHIKAKHKDNPEKLRQTLDREAEEYLEAIAPLCSLHLEEACCGHISEIFSAEPPHKPDGCVAQAWSEGELLRSLIKTRTLAPDVFARWEKTV